MGENTKSGIGNSIELNNANSLVNKFKSQEKTGYTEEFLTMLQGNTNRDVNITDSNIKNNSKFITNLWD